MTSLNLEVKNEFVTNRTVNVEIRNINKNNLDLVTILDCEFWFVFKISFKL